MDQHRLTDVDYEARKAMCSVCGPTTIYWSDKKGGGKTRFCAGKTGVKNPGSRPRQRDDGTWHRLTAREGTGWDCAVCGEDVPVTAQGDRQVCRLRLSVHSSRVRQESRFRPARS